MAKQAPIVKLVLSQFKKLMKKLNFLMKGNNMNKVLFLAAILLVLYVLHTKFLSKEGMEMPAEDVEEALAVSQEKTLVLFHADWCGHCKNLMPKWDKAASEVNAMEGAGVKMVKVECGKPNENDSHKMLMEKYQIKGYPTIKYFENGSVKEFTGERTEEGLKSFLGL